LVTYINKSYIPKINRYIIKHLKSNVFKSKYLLKKQKIKLTGNLENNLIHIQSEHIIFKKLKLLQVSKYNLKLLIGYWWFNEIVYYVSYTWWLMLHESKKKHIMLKLLC